MLGTTLSESKGRRAERERSQRSLVSIESSQTAAGRSCVHPARLAAQFLPTFDSDNWNCRRFRLARSWRVEVRVDNHPPKLLDRVRDAIRVRHYSRRTEEAYVHWIRRYIVFHGKTHPAQMGAAEISRFLTWLAVDRRLSASTQYQALSALLFLYDDLLARPQSGGVGGPQPSRSAVTDGRSLF